jgi:hypothetical protein
VKRRGKKCVLSRVKKRDCNHGQQFTKIHVVSVSLSKEEEEAVARRDSQVLLLLCGRARGEGGGESWGRRKDIDIDIDRCRHQLSRKKVTLETPRAPHTAFSVPGPTLREGG